MTLADLRSLLLEQGFDYLSTTEANAYLNDAYLLDICEADDWPFLEAATTGSAPLTISDLRSVDSVIDSTQLTTLLPRERRSITDNYDTDLTTPGTPLFYYLTSGTTVNVYPANTSDSLTVHYWKAPDSLDDGDSPIFPKRFHSLIVYFARLRAYENSDDFDAEAAAQRYATARLQTMRESLLGQNHDRPSDFVVMVDG